MNAAKIFEGIAILINLAERGEIDPWDVQVIEVIDRYLSELIPTQSAMQVACEVDLSQSGQAFLSASMLVLFKANTLVELEQSEADLEDLSVDDLLLEAKDGVQTKLRLPLEHQLHRRPAALPPQKRRVTLQELIEQLHLMATQLEISQSDQALSTLTTRTRRLRTEAARATLELAHQENLTEVAGELEQFLNAFSPRILNQEQDWLNLDQLVELWIQTKRCAQMTSFTKHQPQDRVSVFWALLLLSAQSKVELSQEEFYQEIKIRTLEGE